MSAAIKIKNSDLLRRVLDQVNILEHRFYDEDMNELYTLLSITSIQSQRISTIITFIDQNRKELLNIAGWCRYKPQELSASVFNDLKKSLEIEEENFILSNEQLSNFTSEKSYPHTIASITVLFKILINLDKLLANEKMTVAHEPQAICDILTQQKHSSPFYWKKSDTDFLELSASLFEVGAIASESHNLTRKEAIYELSKIFNLNIKDAESKLSRAKRRKKNEAPFLDSLRSAFLNACSRKTTRE